MATGEPLAIYYCIDIDTAVPDSGDIPHPRLEVRDHANPITLAASIQINQADGYDYDDCLRKMSGAFLMNGCIDLDSIDVDLRLQICDIEDPPTMTFTVWVDEEAGALLVFENYFEKSYEVGQQTISGGSLFQDPLKSKWIDLEDAAGGAGGGVSRDTPPPTKCMVLRPCYDGQLMISVTERYDTGSPEYSEFKDENAWDDGLQLARMNDEIIDWSVYLIHPLAAGPIMLPMSMVNLDGGPPGAHLDRGDPEFGPDWDLGYDLSHFSSLPDDVNPRALHTLEPAQHSLPPDADFEPMYMSTTGIWPDVRYNVIATDRFMFLWDGRQQTFVDVDAPGLLRLPGTVETGFVYNTFIPLYFPPGTYSLMVTYDPDGYDEKEYLLGPEHNISFAYSSALCVNALGDYNSDRGDGSFWKPDIAKMFDDALADAGYCSSYYKLNRPYKHYELETELLVKETSGFISSLVSYQPILVVDAQDEPYPNGRWNCLLWSCQEPYKKDFVLLPFCWSWRYRDIFELQPSCFIGWKDQVTPNQAKDFYDRFIPLALGQKLPLGESWDLAKERQVVGDLTDPRVQWDQYGRDLRFLDTEPIFEIINCDS